MAFYRQWALGFVGACALAFAGCQEDNEAAMKAQQKLAPSADAKEGPPPAQPKTMEDMAKQYQQQGGGMPSSYPGMSRAKGAAPAPSSSGSEKK